MQKEQIKISKESFELWFNTPLNTIILENHPEKKHLEKLFNNIHYVESNNETVYYEYIKDHFINGLLEKNLFCVLLLNCLLHETDITFKRKNFNINNHKKLHLYISILNAQLEIADNMYWGIFELVKNIVNHAKRKIDDKWEETDGNLIIETTTISLLKKDANNKLWEEYLGYISGKEIKTKSLLRISIEDNGERGLIETTLAYMSEDSTYRDIPADIKDQDRNKITQKIDLCKNNEDEAKLLFDMYFSGSNSFLVRQHKHALKGVGLYKFTKFLSKTYGFLNVQTNKYQNKNDIIAFSLFDTIEPKSPLVRSNLFGFSDYHIILPLQTLTIKKQTNDNFKTNDKIKIEGQALSNSVYEKMLSLNRFDLNNNESILNFEDDFSVAYSKYAIGKKRGNYDIYVCSFKTTNDIDISPLFRSISRLFEINPDKKETVVIRNLSDNSIKRLFDLCEMSGEDNDNNQPFFFKNKILLLLTNKKKRIANEGIVILGDSKNECLKINKYLNQNNASFNVSFNLMTDDEDDIEIESEDIKNFNESLSKFSLLVNGQLIELDAFEYIDTEKTITLFEEKTKNQLITDIDIDIDNGIGYNWKETHLKIGSKLHLRDFIYGKKMFQRSDKASTFAFLLAKDIFKNIEPTINDSSKRKTIYTLVGYGYYSELMVSRTCDFLKNLFEKNDIDTSKTDVEYVIIKDEDEIKFSRYFHNLQNRKNTFEKLLIIVPISSTLTTCLKIENTFYNVLKAKIEEDSKKKDDKDKKYSDYTNTDFEIIQPFYTTVVVGDDIKIQEIATPEFKYGQEEKKYKTIRSVWEGVDLQSKEIITKNREKNQERRNHFNIYIESKWQLPDSCNHCFPNTPIQERPIFVTDKVSVTPSLIFSFPEWYKEGDNIKYNEPYFKFEKDESDHAKQTKLPILDKIHWVHYRGDGNKHFNYYFNYLDFINNNEIEKKLTNWAREIRKNFEKEKIKRTLLIAPDKAENGRFIHIINREIFDDKASVIRFDKNSDHYLNFDKFFKMNISQADAIYFVDNLMLSGKTFFSIDEMLKTAQQNQRNERKDVPKNIEKKITGIFSLVNRMDYSSFNSVIDKLQNNNTIEVNSKKNSTYFYSFLQLNVLESTVSRCPLCEEKDKYKELRNAASLDCIKEYFFKKEMPYFEEQSREELLERNFSYQPFEKKKSSTLLQSAIIHFLNKAIALNHNSIQCFHKTTLPIWDLNGNYKSYINFNGFVEAFRNFIIFEQEHKQCCFKFEKDSKMIVVINELKFKSNLIKVLSGQFCKKYRGIYITIFYWVLCELIAATRTILGIDYNYVGQYSVLIEEENLNNLTNFSILNNKSFSSAIDIDDFIDKTNYLRLIIKYASSLNIAYLLHKDFIASICKFINNIEAIKTQIQLKYESLDDKSEREDLQRKYTENLYIFEDFKVFCAAHISRSLSENQQRAIKFEQNLNDLYVDKSLEDKTFLELLLLENTNIIRQTLIKVENEQYLQKENSLLDDYYKFHDQRDKDLMFEKINLANELQKSLKKDNPNDGEYAENEEKDNLNKIAKIIGCNIQNGGAILLYKYQNVDKDKIKNYCVVGQCGNDMFLSDYFDVNTVGNNYTTHFLEGITYFTETTDDVKYYWTSYALHKQNEKWIGQNNESQVTINGKVHEYDDFSDIKLLANTANRLLFIRISSYNNKDLKGEAVFVFYDNNSEKYDSIHDTRFIHVLRNDISRYLKSKYDNDTFKAWVEEKNKNKPILSLSHGVSTYEEMVRFYKDELRKFNSYIKKGEINNYTQIVDYVDISFTYIVHKLNLISNYTRLRDDKTIKDEITKEYSLNDFIDNIKQKYKYILNFDMDEYTRSKQLETGSIKEPVSKIDTINVDKFFFPESLIEESTFEIFYNIRKYVIEKNTIITKDNPLIIEMRLESENGITYFIVSNNLCLLENNAYLLINNKLEHSKSNSGLNLIYNYLSLFFDRKKNLLKTNIKVENNNNFFEIWIPLN